MHCRTSILALSLGLVMMALMATAHPGGSLIEARQGTSRTIRCASGRTACNNQCVDSTINTNCGTCGNECTGKATCTGGTCKTPLTCSRPLKACPGATSCVNVLLDPANRGACGRKCQTGYKCLAGICYSITQTCPTGQIKCPGGCAALGTDANCKSCGDACTSPQTCQSKSSGCGLSPGTCADGGKLGTDANCAACGVPCTSPSTCQNGVCTSTATPGCSAGGAAACDLTEVCLNDKCVCLNINLRQCPNGGCFNTASDNSHCGPDCIDCTQTDQKVCRGGICFSS